MAKMPLMLRRRLRKLLSHDNDDDVKDDGQKETMLWPWWADINQSIATIHLFGRDANSSCADRYIHFEYVWAFVISQFYYYLSPVVIPFNWHFGTEQRMSKCDGTQSGKGVFDTSTQFAFLHELEVKGSCLGLKSWRTYRMSWLF